MLVSAECKRLMHQESLLFERDYKEHFLAGETKDRHIGEPYLLHHARTNRGVLLIHGLMAAPEEVREWADFSIFPGVYGLCTQTGRSWNFRSRSGTSQL